MKTLREYIFAWGLKRHKERAVFEMKQDLIYLETFKGDMIKYDESKARKRMSELKAIENRNEKQEAELDAVLNVISESKATKANYNQTEKLIGELENYISTL